MRLISFRPHGQAIPFSKVIYVNYDAGEEQKHEMILKLFCLGLWLEELCMLDPLQYCYYRLEIPTCLLGVHTGNPN